MSESHNGKALLNALLRSPSFVAIGLVGAPVEFGFSSLGTTEGDHCESDQCVLLCYSSNRPTITTDIA